MALLIKLYKGDEEILSWGKCNEECTSMFGKPLSKGEYKLDVLSHRAPQTNKEFVEFLKNEFQKNPEEIVNIENVIIRFLSRLLSTDNARSTLNKILNRLKNITGAIFAIVLRPFILVRSSNVPQNATEVPFYAPKGVSSGIAIPIEKYVRYTRPFKYREIDSELIYLSATDLLSDEFYRKLDKLISAIKNFNNYVEESTRKKSKKGNTVESLIEEVIKRVESSVRAGAEIDRVSTKHSDKLFNVVNSKIQLLVHFKISLTQLPPSMDKHELEKSAKKSIYSLLRSEFAKLLGIPEDEVERYLDFSKVNVEISIRGFYSRIVKSNKRLLDPRSMPSLRDVVINFVKTEKALRELEENNRLTAIVKPKATKQEIKRAFEETLRVKVEKVNTVRTFRGEKKAYVRLSPEYDAMKIAQDLGIL